MVRSSFLCLCFVLMLSLSVALTQGADAKKPKKPKKVKCQNKAYPDCYHKKLLCPSDCLRTCHVDCATCQPVCGPAPPPPPSPSSPPPPPYYHSPPPPPLATPSPPPPPYYHSPPPPPVATPSPPPPPVATPSPPPPPVATPSPPPPPAVSVPSGTPHSPPPPAATPSPPPPSPPPSSEAAGAKRVRCRNANYPNCYGLQLTCPADCPRQCEVDCVTCKPVCNCNRPGAVCQDPRFVGGDGLTFYFHGKKDRHFCLLSDPNLHINALFIGKRSPNPKLTRDFTWIKSLGILFAHHNFSIAALKTPTWNDALDRLAFSFEGLPVFLPALDGATWSSHSTPCLTITRLAAANSVEVVVEGLFKLRAVVVPITEKESRVHGYGIVSGEDCFAHLDVSFKFDALSSGVTGVLGQTYAKNYVSRVKMGVPMPVLGGDREFGASGLFAADCLAAKFVR